MMNMSSLETYSHIFNPFVQNQLNELKLHDEISYRHSLESTNLFIEFCKYQFLFKYLSEPFLRSVLLSNIGHLSIPISVLRNRDELPEEQRVMIHQHPRNTAELLKNSQQWLNLDIILYHHENLDGSGYYQLVGKDIPIAAKILRVVDSYTAMVSDRPYRSALSTNEAKEELIRMSDTIYDSTTVGQLINLIDTNLSPSFHIHPASSNDE